MSRTRMKLAVGSEETTWRRGKVDPCRTRALLAHTSLPFDPQITELH